MFMAASLGGGHAAMPDDTIPLFSFAEAGADKVKAGLNGGADVFRRPRADVGKAGFFKSVPT